MGHFMRRLRSYFVAGLMVVTPLVITYLALSWLFGLIDGIMRPWAVLLLGWRWHVSYPGIGALVGILLVLLVGALTTQFFGRQLIRAAEAAVLRLPVVKSIYGTAKSITDALFGANQKAFRGVAVIEYPRVGMYTVAFVTGRVGSLVSLFVATTPNPTSGWYEILPESEVAMADVPVEVAVRLVVSGGVIPLEPAHERALEEAVARLRSRRTAGVQEEEGPVPSGGRPL